MICGLIIGLVMALGSFLLFWFGLDGYAWQAALFALVIFIVIVMASCIIEYMLVYDEMIEFEAIKELFECSNSDYRYLRYDAENANKWLAKMKEKRQKWFGFTIPSQINKLEYIVFSD